jgi:hypothetical protein
MIGSRLVSALLLGIACLAGISYSRPEWWSALGFDRNSHLERDDCAERTRTQKLQRRGEVSARRIEVKRGIVDQMLRSELTLFEAAAWFRYLNENPADCQDDYRKAWPGRSDGEKLCRQVINWVYTELYHQISPSRAEEERDRLEQILDKHLAEHGTVELPRP